MPPPSPVWAWDRTDKKRIFFHTNLHMRVRVEGVWHESDQIQLKVDGAKDEKEK